jgi:hypothetical protein
MKTVSDLFSRTPIEVGKISSTFFRSFAQLTIKLGVKDLQYENELT